MCLVGKCEHLTVAPTVAKGCEMICRAVRIEGKNTMHLLLAVTVGCEETTSQTTVSDLNLRPNDM